MKPMIGIIGGKDDCSVFTGRLHVLRIIEAGGVPVVFSPDTDPEDIVEVSDGILLTEGPDVHPRFYNEDPSPSLGAVDVERDETEIEVVRLAAGENVPLLGIGRGMHVINVALGGTLYQDIYDIPKAIKHDWDPDLVSPVQRLHTVRIKTDSLLYEILKGELSIESTNEARIAVNSFHHQAVKRVGEGLKQVAFAVDGLIEAIEGKEGFLIGVQWWAEFLPEMKSLYRAFVEAAGRRHDEAQETLRKVIEAEVRGDIREQGESRHSSETSDSLPDTNQT